MRVTRFARPGCGRWYPRRRISQGDGKAPDHREFAFRPIQVGREVGDRVTVKEGLKEGEPFVASGAYQLKSELILQNEPEEE